MTALAVAIALLAVVAVVLTVVLVFANRAHPHVTVRLSGEESRVTFAVIDDGQGFNVASMKRGAGLTNMADRLDALGGALDISSSPGEGTTISGSLELTGAAVG
jgi:signal transduction histidine kinase